MNKLLLAVCLSLPLAAVAADKAKCEQAILHSLKLQGLPNVPAKLDYSNKDDIAVRAVDKCIKSSPDAEVDCVIAAKTPAEGKACKGKK